MEYELIEEPFFVRKLGAGKFGTVYLIDQDDTPIALKIILEVSEGALVSGVAQETLEQGKDEYQVLRDLEGVPGVPRVYQLVRFTRERAMWYGIAMQYIGGPSLRNKMYSLHKRGRRVTMHLILKLAYALSGTLLEMQKRGYAHRDIKPENIVLQEPFYHPYLVDFGGACRLSECQGTFGTPLYFDDALNTSSDPLERRYDLADLFSLGRTLQMVWEGDTKSKLGIIITRVDPEAIRIIHPLLLSKPDRRISLTDFHTLLAEKLTARGYHLDEPLYLYGPDDSVLD